MLPPGYPRRLFALLVVATLFEGFDTKLASLVLPLLGREFGVGPQQLGAMLSFTGFGMLAASALLPAADRFGRRPLFLFALGGFAVLTLATAAANGLVAFAALQFGARMLLVTELALAYVMLGEELPAASRGRANALLGAFASVGASLPAFFLAPLESVGLGWRGLFALGALPLLLLPLAFRWLREPPVSAASLAAGPPRWRALLAPGLRGRLVDVSALWWTVSFWSATALYFFTYYAFEERGWTAQHLQWLPLGTLPVGFVGYWGAGWVMDRVGRRPAASLYLVGAAVATLVCFQATRDAWIYAAYFALIGLGGLWTIAATLTTELFPTALRATAMGVANHAVGRTGLILGPLVAGALAERMGSTGAAISLLAGLNLVCLPLLWGLLPETRDVELERAGLQPEGS